MPTPRRTPEATIADVRKRIAGMDYVCSGTLLRRMKTCGKPACACAHDPKARHGPYHEWSRLEKGRLVHTILSAQEGREMARAIRNHRLLRRLLRVWERASLSALKDRPDSPSQGDNR